MPYCTSCGKEALLGDSFCRNCGFALSAPTATATGIGRPSSPGIVADRERINGLDKLKTSFLLFLIGSLAAIIPLVGALGGIVSFVAFIFLILGWRALGRSSFVSSENYRSTGNWLVYSIAIALVVGLVGSMVIIASLVGTLISAYAAGTSPSATSIVQDPAFSRAFSGFYLIIAIVQIVVLLVWNMVRVSLRHLGTEVSQPSLSTAGWLFLLGALLGFAITLSFAIALFTGAITYTSVSSPFMYGGSLGVSFLSLASVPEEAVLAVAAYLGYKAVSSAHQSEQVTRARL